jgi:hypothetical protein
MHASRRYAAFSGAMNGSLNQPAQVVDLVAVGAAHKMRQLEQEDEGGESGVTRNVNKPPAQVMRASRRGTHCDLVGARRPQNSAPMERKKIDNSAGGIWLSLLLYGHTASKSR